MVYGRINTKFGVLISKIEKDGSISGLWFENQKYFPEISRDAIWLDQDDLNSEKTDMEDLGQLENARKTFIELGKQLEEYQAGNLEKFNLPLAPVGSPFQKLIWKFLLDIPFGETTTYGELGKLAAQQMNKTSMSAQAVGGAVGHNPISLLIPCHRVIGSNGKLTGYAGGIDKKVSLLNHEFKDNYWSI